MKCGLLGRKLGHSYSPQIHSLLGDYSYTLFEIEPETLPNFLLTADFDGLNVTMPYKKVVIPYLDELTPIAQSLGAVNTIVRRDGKLIGHNTDYAGFHAMLERSGLSPVGKKCLIFGSGGASTTAQAVLQDLDAHVVVISRSGENNYKNLHRHTDASILVNTTPVGMYPDTGSSPVELCQFLQLKGVLDVVYNPARTKLMMDAHKYGVPAMNGLWMLVAQAKEAAEWFTGTAIPNEKIQHIHTIMQKEMENIILIGMPGCGKSTIGRLLADKCGKKFVDSDAIIEDIAGKSIPRIFSDDGEATFRNWETKALSELGKCSGLVIATGGGCVTRLDNHDLLRQNGTIFWLQRDLDKLPKEGRPLSLTQNLQKMYKLRQPLYAQFCDHIINNNGTLQDAVNAIWEVLE